jgi:hypothetical protein
VHGSAVSLNYLAQNLAIDKIENGDEFAKGFSHAIMTMKASGHFKRLLISNQRKDGIGVKGGH